MAERIVPDRFLTDPTQVDAWVRPGLIVAVNGVDANGEGDPNSITYDVQVFASDGSGQFLQAVPQGWVQYENPVDGVTMGTKPLKRNSPIIVWKVAEMMFFLIPERPKLRACPPAAIQNAASVPASSLAAILARLAIVEGELAAMKGVSGGA